MHGLAMFLGNAGLVLREKSITPTGPRYVRLVGRKAGLVSFLMTILGIDTTTIFEVYEDRIEYSCSSLSGRFQELIPLVRVSNLCCGYFKPVLFFVFAVIALIGGFAVGMIARADGSPELATPATVVGVIFSAIFFVCYFLKKTIVVNVIPNSASPVAIAFKRSLIENQTITQEDARQIIDIITTLVSRANRPR